MPNPIRFALVQLAGGLGAAAVFLAALLATNPGGLAGLLLDDRAGPLPLLLL